MKGFPDFMKRPVNKISSVSQYTKNIEGYVFDGVDGSQMAFWTVYKDGRSAAHVHDYDEYMLVVQGQYTLAIDGKRIPVKAGEEYLIKKGIVHGGEVIAGTRTIEAFGGKRVERAAAT
ncbi:MAG: cupin domain-containing protein [Dehalococcoidales bacterium]|jgi:quercetin dioxygenase-like cupin family protein